MLMLTFHGWKQIPWLEGEEKWKTFEQTQRLLQKCRIQLFNPGGDFVALAPLKDKSTFSPLT